MFSDLILENFLIVLLTLEAAIQSKSPHPGWLFPLFISGLRFAHASLINGWYGHILRRRRWRGAGTFCKKRLLDANKTQGHILFRLSISNLM